MERFKHQGRDIFDGDKLAAQTISESPSLFSHSQAVSFAGRIVAIMNMTNGIPLELIAEKLRADR